MHEPRRLPKGRATRRVTGTTSLSSRRPYLLRAMHEWMTDNRQTAHIVVDARHDGVAVPAEHVSDGKIILNISTSATGALRLGNDAISFTARFGGTPFDIYIPVTAVLGIYARETGQGMIFSGDDGDSDPPDDDNDSRRAHLKVVK